VDFVSLSSDMWDSGSWYRLMSGSGRDLLGKQWGWEMMVSGG